MMIKRLPNFPVLGCLLVLSWLTGRLELATPANAQEKNAPIKVELRQSNGRWQLFRAGAPYYIRGAGGPGSLEMLAACGANSNRTWGADEEIRQQLDEAHQRGLSVAVGIWLEHTSPKFDYNNFENVAAQVDNVLAAVRRFKDHPAVLLWGIGNEMEGAAGDNPAVWSHVEHLARLIQDEDPNHPTMSVIAEMGGKKIEAIHKLCPSLDIVGINSYGGASSLPARYRQSGGTKPYIVTEFGPVGTWEVPKNSFGAISEPTSTEKAVVYRNVYQKIAADQELCLGSYAFLWGQKQEGTATWFGLLLPNGNKTSPVDVLVEAWSGKPPVNRCPIIESLSIVTGQPIVAPGAKLELLLKTRDPENDRLTVHWTMLAEANSYVTGGSFQETPELFANRFVPADQPQTTVSLPEQPGLYRIYVTVDDGNQASAVANLVVQVTGAAEPAAPTNAKKTAMTTGDQADGAAGEVTKVEKESLPFVVFDEAGNGDPFTPSGWMGNAKAMKLTADCSMAPFAGKVCLQCDYKLTSDWGGVVWQSPANDWGDQPGGFDLSTAKKLTFHAKGRAGGESITLGVGLIGTDKPFYDTTKQELAVTLTKEWQKFTIDLTAADLSRIKSGFWFSLAGQSEPLTFYLDQIQFEGE